VGAKWGDMMDEVLSVHGSGKCLAIRSRLRRAAVE